MNLEQEVKELEDSNKLLTKQLATNKQRIQLLLEQLADVKVGDIVVINKSWYGLKEGEEYQVTSVRFHGFDNNKPWLQGIGKKKDGSWGKQEKNLYTYWRKP